MTEIGIPVSAVYPGGGAAVAASGLERGGMARGGAGWSKRTFLAGLVVGVGTAFSFQFAGGDENFGAMVVQGASLGAAMLLLLAADPGWPLRWAKHPLGLLLLAHVAIAVVSGVVNEASPWAVLRYALLLPAASMMISSVRQGTRGLEGMRAGLTAAGVVFAGFHLAYLSPSELLDPAYRLTVFLNPNGVGFICAGTAISLLDYILRKKILRWRPLMLCQAAMFLACFAVCFATKSRTAMAVMLAGCALRVYLRMGFTRVFAVGLIVAVLAVTVAWSFTSEVGSQLAATFQLENRYRRIDEGTGRFRAWVVIVEEIWWPNKWIGVGPSRHEALAREYGDISSAHNGLLANLADVGILGALPLVMILALAVRRGWRRRKDVASAWAITLLLAGCTESFAETMFFSIGNPVSLLFLLALAYLLVDDDWHSAPPEAGLQPWYMLEPDAAAAGALPAGGDLGQHFDPGPAAGA